MVRESADQFGGGVVEGVEAAGEGGQVEVQDAGQGRDGEEGGGRDGAAFDLPEGVEGEAGVAGDGGGAAGAAGGAQDLAEGLAPVALFVGERPTVSYRSPREWEVMREAGRVVARTLEAVRGAAEPGVPLKELDAVAARVIKENGARPSFLDYHPSWAPVPYPATICVSVNDGVVHGIPGARVLQDGDLVSVDCGAEVGG